MDQELSLLIKPVSADCNMRCEYCFYRRPTDPYRSAERHIMDDPTLKTMISRYMKSAGRCASFGWQGGEPLLAGIDFFRRVVNYQQIYGLPAQLVGNNLQTNGLLIDAEWAKFFRQYNFFIGVSLDGPEECHNFYRRSANGAGGFQQTMKGIRTLRDHQVEFSILSVVNDVTAKSPGGLYDFFIRNGLDRLQFIPCLEINRETGEAERHSVTVEDYRDFLCTLFDVWYNNGRPVASISLFENILAIYMGKDPEICAFKDRCGSYVVIEYNGDVYPCDFFVEEQWLLGNLRETSITDIIKKRKWREFNDRKMQQSPGCNTCEWNFICHYGCQHYRSPAGENYFCHAYREFFQYTRRRFETLTGNLLKAESEGSGNPKRTPLQSYHDAEKGRAIRMKNVFHINRLLEPGQYRLEEVFADIRTYDILLAIFADAEELDGVITRIKVFVVDMPHEMFVNNDDASITIGLTHLRQASDEFLYLDIIHELCHVKQQMEGRNLYDRSKAYVDRETEIEAYRVTVQEARRIGLNDDAITHYLRVSWITPEEHKRLARRLDVTGSIPEGDLR